MSSGTKNCERGVSPFSSVSVYVTSRINKTASQTSFNVSIANVKTRSKWSTRSSRYTQFTYTTISTFRHWFEDGFAKKSTDYDDPNSKKNVSDSNG